MASTVQESLTSLFSLEGRVALVTGGTRGIGQAMAYGLAEAGATILLAQRDASNLETYNHITQTMKRPCKVYSLDLFSRESIEALLPAVVADGYRVDILLNSGGIQRRHAAAEFPDDDWDAVLAVNLTAVFQLCRAVGSHMIATPTRTHSTHMAQSQSTSQSHSQSPAPVQSRGCIINVASLLSFQGGINVVAYSASKGGVAQLTKALSNDWAPKGVRVNAIAPGYIATEMNDALMKDEDRAAAILGRIPAGRWGSPDDFKGVVVWLASRAAAYVTGEIVTVDGGWMAR